MKALREENEARSEDKGRDRVPSSSFHYVVVKNQEMATQLINLKLSTEIMISFSKILKYKISKMCYLGSEYLQL